MFIQCRRRRYSMDNIQRGNLCFNNFGDKSERGNGLSQFQQFRLETYFSSIYRELDWVERQCRTNGLADCRILQ